MIAMGEILQDIPSLTAEAAKDHPGISYIITAPLGLHEQLVVGISKVYFLNSIGQKKAKVINDNGKVLYLLVLVCWQDVVNDRISHCLSHAAGVAEECEVCAGTGKCRFN